MTAKLVEKIILGRVEFCRLCFGDVGDDDLRFHDEVVLNLQVEKVSGMLTHILGGKYTSDMSVHDIFCSNCVELLKNSYNFIQMCKNNSERLLKTVDVLNDCFQNTAQNIKSCNSVLIQIDPRDYTFMQFYQYRKIARNLPASLDMGRSKYSISNKIVSKAKIQKANKAVKLLENKLKLRASRLNSIAGLKTDIQAVVQSQPNIQSKPDIQSQRDKPSQRDSQILKDNPSQSLRVNQSQSKKDNPSQRDNKSHEDIKIKKKGEGLRESKPSQSEKDNPNQSLSDNASQKDNKTHEDINIEKRSEGLKESKPKPIENNESTDKRRFRILKSKSQQIEYKCGECGKSYKGRHNVVIHMAKTHSDETPFQCEHCDMKFKIRGRLLEHIRMQHLEPSIQCDLCGARYRCLKTVYSHRARHFDPKSTLYLPKVFPPSTSL